MSIYFYFFWILLDSSQATEHVHCLPNFTYDTVFMFMLLKSCTLYQPQLSNIALQQYLECSTNKQLSPGIKRKKSSSFHQLWERLYRDQLHSANSQSPPSGYLTKHIWLCKIIFINYLDFPCPAKQNPKTTAKKVHNQNHPAFLKNINQQISCMLECRYTLPLPFNSNLLHSIHLPVKKS